MGGVEPAPRHRSPDQDAMEAGSVAPQHAAHDGAAGADQKPWTPPSADRAASTVRRFRADLGDRGGHGAGGPPLKKA